MDNAADTPGAHSGAPFPPLDVALLGEALRDSRLGMPLIYFPSLDSTNSHAFELAREGAAEGTLIMTDDQTAGRGRIGRTWKSLPGQQLAFSLVLRPTFPAHFLVMAAAVAVADAVSGVTGLPADIKWPNDVLVQGRKVCGILIETSEGFAVLGIGINANGSLADDPELGARATTLAQERGAVVSREALAAEVLRGLDRIYTALMSGGAAAQEDLRDIWRARLVTLGRPVTLRQGEATVAGVAEDVDADGALLLRLGSGTLKPVTWGDVE
jgi:BirA family biotin operon repressor/biotin-[acetyl-CoA-carboxylase] ligase